MGKDWMRLVNPPSSSNAVEGNAIVVPWWGEVLRIRLKNMRISIQLVVVNMGMEMAMLTSWNCEFAMFFCSNNFLPETEESGTVPRLAGELHLKI